MSTKPQFDNVKSLNDPQFLHNWKMDIKFPSKGTYPDPDAISWRVLTSDIPTASVLHASMTVRGHTVAYPSGIVKYTETLAMTFIEDKDGTVKEFMRQWREACAETRTGKAGKKSEVEARITLTMLDTQDNSTFSITLYGCMYENSNLNSLENGSAANMQQPQLTIRYDIFEDKKGG